MNYNCGNHDPNKRCIVEGCSRLGSSKGHCPNCGLFRRRNRCNNHISHNNKLRKQYRIFKKKNCEHCDTNDQLTVHHIDGDVLNNAVENLQTLCRKCHDMIEGIVPRITRAKPIIKNSIDDSIPTPKKAL